MTSKSELQRALTLLTPVAEKRPVYSFTDKDGKVHVSKVITYNCHVGAFPNALTETENDRPDVYGGLINVYQDLQDLFALTELVNKLGRKENQDFFGERVVRLAVSSFFRTSFSITDHIGDALLCAYAADLIEITKATQPNLEGFMNSQLGDVDKRVFQFLINQLDPNQPTSKIFDERLRDQVQSASIFPRLVEIKRWLSSGKRSVIDVSIEADVPYFRIYKLNDKFLFSGKDFPSSFFHPNKDTFGNFLLISASMIADILVALDVAGDVLLDKLNLERNVARHIDYGHNEAREWMQLSFDAFPD